MSRLINVVPTVTTRRVASLMIQDAEVTTGADAVLRHLREIPPGQHVALIALLLSQCKLTAKQGAYSVVNQHGTILKRGHELSHVLKVFDKALRLIET